MLLLLLAVSLQLVCEVIEVLLLEVGVHILLLKYQHLFQVVAQLLLILGLAA